MRRARRPDATPKPCVGAWGPTLLLGRDEADLERRWQRLSGANPARRPSWFRQQEPAVSWEAFRERGLAGTVQEVAEAISSLEELGVEEVILGLGVIPFQVADEEDVAFAGQELGEALRRR